MSSPRLDFNVFKLNFLFLNVRSIAVILQLFEHIYTAAEKIVYQRIQPGQCSCELSKLRKPNMPTLQSLYSCFNFLFIINSTGYGTIKVNGLKSFLLL